MLIPSKCHFTIEISATVCQICFSPSVETLHRAVTKVTASKICNFAQLCRLVTNIVFLPSGWRVLSILFASLRFTVQFFLCHDLFCPSLYSLTLDEYISLFAGKVPALQKNWRQPSHPKLEFPQNGYTGWPHTIGWGGGGKVGGVRLATVIETFPVVCTIN